MIGEEARIEDFSLASAIRAMLSSPLTYAGHHGRL